MIETYAKPLDFHIQKSISGKIKIKSKDPSQSYVKITLLSLLALTVLGFATFDYKGIDIIKALGETLVNIKTMFLEASLTHFTIYDAIKQVGITMSLSFLTTLIGGVIALFLSNSTLGTYICCNCRSWK